MKKAVVKYKSHNNRSCMDSAQCHLLGYCLREKELEKEREKRKQAEEEAYRMRDASIAVWVPSNVPKHVSYHLGEYSRMHLQVAFDAYHDQDYETAILHCKAVIDGNCSCYIAYICLIASEYFSGNYADATYYATRAEEQEYTPRIWRTLRLFNIHCMNLLRGKTEAEAKAKTEEIAADKIEKAIEHTLQGCLL